MSIHSDSQELFDLAVNYFHNCRNNNKTATRKRVDFYFIKKKTLSRGRWDLDNWNKRTYLIESWSRDITVSLDYQKGIIRSYLSSQCKFPRETIEDLLIFRPLSLLLIKHGFFAIHAGCVAKNGQGIIISAGFGRGKTMTALHLARKGFKFLSDEYLLLKESEGKIKAYAFPQRIGIKKNLINKFSELKFLRYRKDSPHGKKRFWISEVYPYAAVKMCCPQLIIFPHFKKNCLLSLRPTTKKETFFNISKDKDNLSINKRLVFKDMRLRYFNILSSLVEQIDAYNLEYSNNNLCDLARIIKEEGYFI